MKICGYKQKFRSEVLKSAKSAYEKILEKHKKEETPFYKNRKELDQIKSKKNQTPQTGGKKPLKTPSLTQQFCLSPPPPMGGWPKH